jgi:hypothetical protein
MGKCADSHDPVTGAFFDPARAAKNNHAPPGIFQSAQLPVCGFVGCHLGERRSL